MLIGQLALVLLVHEAHVDGVRQDVLESRAAVVEGRPIEVLERIENLDLVQLTQQQGIDPAEAGLDQPGSD